MTRRTSVTLAIAVLAVGFCAAWPFRRSHPLEPPAAGPRANPELVLKQAPPVRRAPEAETQTPASPPSAPEQVMPPEGASPAVFESSSTSETPPSTLEPRPSVSRSEPPAPALPPSHATSAAESHSPQRPSLREWRRHRIKDGDTLSRLAEVYLGDATRAEEIFAFNRDVLASPRLLPIGRWLRIPPRDSATEAGP